MLRRLGLGEHRVDGLVELGDDRRRRLRRRGECVPGVGAKIFEPAFRHGRHLRHGRDSRRVIASILTLFARYCSRTESNWKNSMSTCPATISLMACAVPRYGTWTS